MGPWDNLESDSLELFQCKQYVIFIRGLGPTQITVAPPAQDERFKFGDEKADAKIPVGASKVKDMGLAEFGRKELELVEPPRLPKSRPVRQLGIPKLRIIDSKCLRSSLWAWDFTP